MNRFTCALTAAALGLAAFAARADTEVTLDLEPACPYGYYDTYPYQCAPYGYYGPEWFISGVFVGAGPWFHGPAHFHGHVDNHFDARLGYRGALPQRGDRVEPSRRLDRIEHFAGHELRDGRGMPHTGRR